MFHNTDIANQPIFYLFIAFTFILVLGYYWGNRANNKIYLSALNILTEIFKPKDQTFTRIGGMTGYHANIIPENTFLIKQVDATILLLPRHSWLYFPFSYIFMRHDKFYINIEFKPKKFNLKEGHIINKNYYKFRCPKITNEINLQKEDYIWGDKKYLIYYEDQKTKNDLLKIITQIKNPETIKHIAIVPDNKRIHLFLIPEYKKIARPLDLIYKWIFSIANNNME